MRLWDSVKAAASGVEDDGSYDTPTGPEDSRARRAAAFRVTPSDLGLPEEWGTKPFGVIVELCGAGGVTTIAAFANGDASLLHQNGSGIIGRPSHVHVVVQAKRLVDRAANFARLLNPTVNFPEPQSGSVRFYFLTVQGVLTGEAGVEEVLNGNDPLSPLMEVADELVSEFRQYTLLDELPPGPLESLDWIKAFAMVGVIAGLTYAAWLIPMPWLRWPAVAVGAFFTISALIVPYAMLTASEGRAEKRGSRAAN